mgnify:CR=1 FL=1
MLHLLIFAVDDHAVGNAPIELLHMPRPQPYGHGAAGMQQLTGDNAEPLPGAHLQSLHAQHHGLVPQCLHRLLRQQRPQALGADGDDDHLRLLHVPQVGGQPHRFRQRQQIVLPRGQKGLHPGRAFPPVQGDVVADMIQIPCDQRAPAPAADDEYVHGCLLNGVIAENRLLYFVGNTVSDVPRCRGRRPRRPA